MSKRILLMVCIITSISVSGTFNQATQAATVTRIGGGGSAINLITGLILEDLYYPGNQEIRDAVFQFDYWNNIWDNGQLNFITSAQAQIFAQAIFDTVSVLNFDNYNELFADEDWTYGGRSYCYVPYAIDEINNTMSAWVVSYHPVNGWYTDDKVNLSLANYPLNNEIMFAVAETPEVPIPGTLLLFGTSMIGLAGIRKKIRA